MCARGLVLLYILRGRLFKRRRATEETRLNLDILNWVLGANPPPNETGLSVSTLELFKEED